MESLSRQVLEANEKYKNALDQHTRKLQRELDIVNNLIVRLLYLLAMRPAQTQILNIRLLLRTYPMSIFKTILETNGVYMLMERSKQVVSWTSLKP